MELSKDLDLAIRAAQAASTIIKEGFGKVQSVKEKEGKGFVTEIDTAAEKAILGILQSGSTYSIYSEEAGKLSGSTDGEWVIDPLDGTTDFMHGIPLFAVSIALKKENKIALGVVMHPMTGEIFYAERGAGAFCDGEPIHVSATPTLASAIVVPNRGYGDWSRDNYIELVRRLAASSVIRNLGTTALELAYLAAGKVDVFVCSGDELYDHAAGIVIVEEAGGRVTDWDGKEWDPSNVFVSATNAHLHDEVLDVIKGMQK